MVWIMGIGGSNHDFSAALLNDAALHTAIEDERLTGHRYGSTHWASSPCRPSFDYSLQSAGISPDDLGGLFVSADLEGHDRFWETYDFQFVGHHLCHAAAAFYPSPFEEAAVLVIDGRGGPIGEKDRTHQSFETLSIGFGKGNKITLDTVQSGSHAVATSTWSYISSNSIGWFYSIITEACGLGENGEGKTMALAAYGQPKYVANLLDFVAFNPDTIFEMNPYNGLWDFLVDTIRQAPDSFSVRANLAASGQQILEEAVVAAARLAQRKTSAKMLSFGGGVALNGVANHRVREETGFDEVFIFPASGDNGLSAGAALHGAHKHFDIPRPAPSWQASAKYAYGGRTYEVSDISSAVEPAPVSSRTVSSLVDRAKMTAERLIGGSIVAVFQGGAEFGPRALGNRSILALPGSQRIQARMNAIKQRESFRPFAPIVLEQAASEYFELKGPSPFMLDIAPVRHKYRESLAGICHVDGTARVQTLSTGSNPLIEAVLSELQDRGYPPVVLNTSFNLKGCPIVETPNDAVSAFLKLSIDFLLIGAQWLEKQTTLDFESVGMTRHAY